MTPEFRRIPCLCGGQLSAWDRPADILTAVVRHQETAQHTTWSLRLYGPPNLGPSPTFVPPPDPALPVDVSRTRVVAVDGKSATGRT